MADESLSVQITFENAQQVQRQLQDIQKALGDLGNTVPKGAGFDQLTESAAALSKSLKGISATSIAPQADPQSIEQMAVVAAAVAKELNKVQKAGRNAASGIEEVEKEATRAERAMSTFKKAVSITVGSFLGLSLFNTAQKALAGFTNQLKQAKQLFIDTQAAVLRFAGGLQAVGRFSESAIKGIQAYAQEIQNTTGISDDLVTSASALIAQLGGLSGKGLTRATDAAIELSKVLGINLQTAALLVAKAAQGNTTQFQRYGVVIDKNIPKHKRFAELLNTIETRFKGTAELAGRGLGGSLDKLARSWDDLLKALGGQFQFAQPFIDKLTDKIQKFNTTLDNQIDNVVVASDTMKRMTGILADYARKVAKANETELEIKIREPRRPINEEQYKAAFERIKKARKDLDNFLLELPARINDSLKATYSRKPFEALIEDSKAAKQALDGVFDTAKQTVGLDLSPAKILEKFLGELELLEKQSVFVLRASGEVKELEKFVQDANRVLQDLERKTVLVSVEAPDSDKELETLRKYSKAIDELITKTKERIPVRTEELFQEEISALKELQALAGPDLTVKLIAETDQFSPKVAVANKALSDFAKFPDVDAFLPDGFASTLTLDDFKLDPRMVQELEQTEFAIATSLHLEKGNVTKFVQEMETVADLATAAFDKGLDINEASGVVTVIDAVQVKKALELVKIYERGQDAAQGFTLAAQQAADQKLIDDDAAFQAARTASEFDALRNTLARLAEIRGASPTETLQLRELIRDTQDAGVLVGALAKQLALLQAAASSGDIKLTDDLAAQLSAMVALVEEMLARVNDLGTQFGAAGGEVARGLKKAAGSLAGIIKSLDATKSAMKEFTEQQLFVFNQFADASAAAFQNAWDNIFLSTQDFGEQMLRLISGLVSSIIAEFIKLKVFGLFLSAATGGASNAPGVLDNPLGPIKKAQPQPPPQPLKVQQIQVPDTTGPIIEFSRLLRAQQRQQARAQQPIVVRVPEQPIRQEQVRQDVTIVAMDGTDVRRQYTHGALRAESARAARRKAL